MEKTDKFECTIKKCLIIQTIIILSRYGEVLQKVYWEVLWLESDVS